MDNKYFALIATFFGMVSAIWLMIWSISNLLN